MTAMPRRRFGPAGGVACLLALALLAAPAGLGAQQVSEDSLREHTRFLAHDSLRGRAPGTPGERRSADYLGDRLARYGLRPLPGRAGPLMPVPLMRHVFGGGSTLTVRRDGGERTLRPPAFYHPGGGPAAFRDFQGELLVAGATPGALAALEGVDVSGRVVVLAPPWGDADQVEEALVRRGASGAIEVVPDGRMYRRLRVVRGPDRFSLPAEVAGPGSTGPLPRLVVGPDALGALGLEEVVRPGRTPDRALRPGVRVEAHLDVSARSDTAYNVAALLEGTDPDLADEAVVYVAHHDHVGLGEPTAGDSVWNGFVDNAAGVAMVLEIARVLAADPPPRPVVVLFTTAEEQGLLGATWFLHREILPPGGMRAVINLDGGAPPPGIRSWQVAGPDGSPVRERAVEAIEEAGGTVATRPVRPDSDHWPFHRRGVPALFLYPGSLAEGVRPHTAKDEWRADFPFGGLARYAAAGLAVGRRLAEERTAAGDPARAGRPSGLLPGYPPGTATSIWAGLRTTISGRPSCISILPRTQIRRSR